MDNSRVGKQINRVKAHLYNLNFVKKKVKKGYLSQVIEMMKLRLGPNRLGASEYYFYRLFDDGIFSYEQKREFIGWRKEQEIDKAMNLDDWRAIANDKLVFYSLMKGLGLPHPKVKAVFRYGCRFLEGVKILNSVEDVRKFLRDGRNYPLFLKPIEGAYGGGAIYALNYDNLKHGIMMSNGKVRELKEVVETVTVNPLKGYIFSEVLKPHPDIERLCGRRLSSVRVIVLVDKGVPRLFRAVLKIPTGENIADNFMHGETGNMVAFINVVNGCVERVVGGTGFSLSLRECHPDTNQRLTGCYMPYWNQIIKICLDAASVLPGLRMQHWDIALCPDGPVVLEVNVEGSLDLPQIAAQQGIYDEELKNYVLANP